MMSEILVFLDLWPSPAEAARPFQAAKRLGFEVLLVARSPTAAQVSAADYCIRVDTYNAEEVLKAVASFPHVQRIVGVAKWLDRSVELAALICEELGLPSMSSKSAKTVRSKFLCKQAAQTVGVRVPKFFEVQQLADVLKAAKDLKFPAIIKPVSASASRFIFRCLDEAELIYNFNRLEHYTKNEIDPILSLSKGYVVEEFIHGDLVTIDGMVSNGDVYIAGIIGHKNTEDKFLDWQHIFPAKLSEHLMASCTSAAKRILAATGVDHTPFQIEGIVTESEFVFIEMAARTAGDYNSTHLIPAGLITDYLGDCIRSFVGLRPNNGLSYSVPDRHYVGTRYKIIGGTGIFCSIEGIDDISRLHGFDHIFIEAERGMQIRQPPEDHFSCRVASVFVSGSSYDEVEELLSKIDDMLEVKLYSS